MGESFGMPMDNSPGFKTCVKCTYEFPENEIYDDRCYQCAFDETIKKLDAIDRWCKAYPTDMFIGEKFDLARHVLEGIQKIIEGKK